MGCVLYLQKYAVNAKSSQIEDNDKLILCVEIVLYQLLP